MATTSSGADPAMVNKIASHLKSQGIFDQFRRDCLEDVDTKVSELRSRYFGPVKCPVLGSWNLERIKSKVILHSFI